MKRFGPVTRRQGRAGQSPVHGPNRRAGAVDLLDRPDALGQEGRRIALRPGRRDPARGPDVAFVRLPHRRHGLGGNPEEARCELPGRIGFLPIDDRRRGGDADGIPGVPAAERTQSADQAGGFRALRARERVGLIEDKEVQPRSGEEFDVPLTGEERFELLERW